MSIRIAINGVGRVCRLIARGVSADPGIHLVAINSRGDTETMANLLKYDSVHRRFDGQVRVRGNDMEIDGSAVRVTQADDSELSWRGLDLDLVVESTGQFRTRKDVEMHLKGGAPRVLITAPPKDDTPVVVVGVNEDVLSGNEPIVSASSCTTNCAGPMVKVLHEAYGVESAHVSTLHAYTNDQALVDRSHEDARRGRAASASIIPTSTGAAAGIGRLLPDLDGKIAGMAYRIPVMAGSMVEIVARVGRATTVADVNAAFSVASSWSLRGLLEYNEDPIVSADVVGSAYSCVFDSLMTEAVGDRMVKICGWYDNEWGYVSRCIDLVEMMCGAETATSKSSGRIAELATA